MTNPIGIIFTAGLKNSSAPSNYPENWREISKAFRKERRYKCEKCDVDCSKHQELVEAHHKNGDKSNCTYNNLSCLCKYCHSKEDFHNHYKVAEKDKKNLEQLWEEQGIDINKIWT